MFRAGFREVITKHGFSVRVTSMLRCGGFYLFIYFCSTYISACSVNRPMTLLQYFSRILQTNFIVEYSDY